jgi:CBS domain-containing protein
MHVADICTTNIVSINAGAALLDAAELMRTRHVGSLPVTADDQPNGAPSGILTDRDIVLAVVAPGVDVASLNVADVMTREPATCRLEDDLFDTIQVMRNAGVRRLPVLDRGGHLTGMVALDDIFHALSMQLGELSRVFAHEQARERVARA